MPPRQQTKYGELLDAVPQWNTHLPQLVFHVRREGDPEYGRHILVQKIDEVARSPQGAFVHVEENGDATPAGTPSPTITPKLAF